MQGVLWIKMIEKIKHERFILKKINEIIDSVNILKLNIADVFKWINKQNHCGDDCECSEENKFNSQDSSSETPSNKQNPDILCLCGKKAKLHPSINSQGNKSQNIPALSGEIEGGVMSPMNEEHKTPDIYDKNSGHTGFCSKYCYHFKKIRNQTLDEVLNQWNKSNYDYSEKQANDNFNDWLTSKIVEMREEKK